MLTHHDEIWLEMDNWEYQQSLAQELERAVTRLQEDLAASLYDDDDDFDFETPSGYPYCGCDTCLTRELLVVIVPMVANAVEAGRMRRPDEYIDVDGIPMPMKTRGDLQ